MARRPATVTQADVARIIRAAKQEGLPSVEVKAGGAVFVLNLKDAPVIQLDDPIPTDAEIVL